MKFISIIHYSPLAGYPFPMLISAAWAAESKRGDSIWHFRACFSRKTCLSCEWTVKWNESYLLGALCLSQGLAPWNRAHHITEPPKQGFCWLVTWVNMGKPGPQTGRSFFTHVRPASPCALGHREDQALFSQPS